MGFTNVLNADPPLEKNCELVCQHTGHEYFYDGE